MRNKWKIITTLLLISIVLASCGGGTTGTMKDIISNLKESKKNVEKLISILDSDIDLAKIEKMKEENEELYAERSDLMKALVETIERKNDIFYIGNYIEKFNQAVEDHKLYGEYTELVDEIEALQVTSGAMLRPIIMSNLDGVGKSLVKLLDEGREGLGTFRQIFTWHFKHDIEEELEDLFNEIDDSTSWSQKLSPEEEINVKVNILQSYIDENPWFIEIVSMYENYHVNEPDKSLGNVVEYNYMFRDTLYGEEALEVRKRILSNN